MEFLLTNFSKLQLSNQKQFLQTGEIGVVSNPFTFDVIPHLKNANFQYQYHDALCKNIKIALMETSTGYWPSREAAEEISQIRVSIIVKTEPVQLDEDEQFENTTRQVKVKIFSAFSLDAPVEIKEQGLLTKLARILGEANLRLKISLRMNGEANGSFETAGPTECTWNERNFAWETETELKIRKRRSLSGPIYNVTLESLILVINDVALNEVLLRKVHSAEERANLLRNLEDESFTDMTMTGSNGVLIKCHRIHIAAASPVLTAMFNENPTNMKESKTCLLELEDMSEDGIRSMLRFIYSKDCMPLCTSVEITLELLQAGHKYLMPDLIDVATLLLMTKPKDWFGVDSVVELFCFARNIDGGAWKGLVMKGVRVLKWFIENHQDKIRASNNFNELSRKIYSTANAVGHDFANALFRNVVFGEEEVDMPPSAAAEEVSKEDVCIMLDFVTLFAAEEMSKNMDLTFQTLLFSYKYDVNPPFLTEEALNLLMAKPNDWFKVDAAVAIFCLATKANCEKWEGLKLKSVQVLKWYLLEHPEDALNSVNYNEMFEKNFKYAQEFTRLCVQLSKPNRTLK